MIEDQANIYPDADLIMNIEHFFDLIGAKSLIHGADPQKRMNAIHDFLTYVLIRNEQLPQKASIQFVFEIYANNIASGKVERRGNNVAALSQAMRQMVDEIHSLWNDSNKEQIHALPAPKSEPGFKNDSDSRVWYLYHTVMKFELETRGNQSLFANENSFFSRLRNEYESRGLSADDYNYAEMVNESLKDAMTTTNKAHWT
jgi:hypothetical protein